MLRKTIIRGVIFIVGAAIGAAVASYAVHNKYKFFSEVSFFERTLNEQEINLFALNFINEGRTERLVTFYEAQACMYYQYIPLLGEGINSHEITLATDKYFSENYPDKDPCELNKKIGDSLGY